MSDEILKNMWNKTENVLGASNYESNTIERFTAGRSDSVAQKIRTMLHFDIALKALVSLMLALDVTLYFNTNLVLIIGITGIVILISLILYQFKVLQRFSKIADYGQSTKEKLSGMLTFLQSRFFTALLSIASTYIFVFISGSLLYFYAVYGQVRALDGIDIIVFSIFIIIGIVMNFFVNFGQVRYHIKHIELCLSDLNDNVLAIVTQNIETQQKQDRTTKFLLGLVLVFGFVLLIAILKKFGM
jgi:hypothetical protein